MDRRIVLLLILVSSTLVGCSPPVSDIELGEVELQLVGDPEIIIVVGQDFDDPGILATDSVRGDISSDVIVGGDVIDTDTCGTYIITYKVQDSQGVDVKQVQRVVQVVLQFDDFEELDFSAFEDGRYWGVWDFRNDDRWEIVAYDGGSVLRRGGDDGGGAARLNISADARFRYRFKVLDFESHGSAYKRLRYHGRDEYRVFIRESGLEVTRRVNEDTVTLARSWEPIELGRWYEMETMIFDTHIRVYLDGERVIDYVDTSDDAIVGASTYRFQLEGFRSWMYYDQMLVACISSIDDEPVDPGEPEGPAVVGGVALTYVDCPHTSMRISWQTDRPISSADITYSSDFSIPADSHTKTGAGTSQVSAHLPDTWIHRVELTGLNPGTEYAVAIPAGEDYETFSFSTLPENSELRFLVGADSHVWPPGSDTSRRRTTNALAAEFDPDFILKVGDLWYGDLSYDQTYGAGTRVGNVKRWFDDWHEVVITSEGRRIPIVPAKGNHDYEFYDELFPDQNYYVMEFGDGLTLITLNSGHGTWTSGIQRDWLEQTLQDYQDSKWLLVQFHVSPYPSHRDKTRFDAKAIHDNWLELFDQYGVDLVLVGHDHVYHRTYPLFDNAINQEAGVIYLGVNSWAGGRSPEDKWYLEESITTGGGFFEFTLSADQNELKAQHYSQAGDPVGMELFLYKD